MILMRITSTSKENTMANSARRAQIIPGFYGSPGSGPANINISPAPIVTNYDPRTSDQGDALGNIWINSTSGAAWVLTQNVGNTNTWTSVGSSISPSVASIAVSAGPTTLSYLGAGVGVFNGSGVLTSRSLANGQILIGNAGTPVAATLTGGTGIGIINGPGSITISATGLVDQWSSKAVSFNAAVANGYVITAGSGSVNATLPTVASLGDSVEIIYPSATGGDILEITSTAGKLRMPGDGTARTHYTWPDASFSGADNPSVTVVCTISSATVPQWTVAEVTGSPTGS